MRLFRTFHEASAGDVSVGIIALGAVSLEMVVSARYGYHRDELYFLVAGQHPALGYFDQPPLARWSRGWPPPSSPTVWPACE